MIVSDLMRRVHSVPPEIPCRSIQQASGEVRQRLGALLDNVDAIGVLLARQLQRGFAISWWLADAHLDNIMRDADRFCAEQLLPSLHHGDVLGRGGTFVVAAETQE